MNKSDSLTKLAPALLAAQKAMGSALKDAKNPFFKSKFADLNAVIDAAVPTLNDQGIVVLQNPTTIETALGLKSVVQTILLHQSGEYITSETDIVVAKQNDPQAYGSAVTYARRYGLQAAVTLKAEDNDAEGQYDRSAKTEVLKSTVKTASAEVVANKVSSGSTQETSAKTSPTPFTRSKPKTASKSGSEDII